LVRQKRRFTISTLSNGNLSLLVDMAKHGGLPWDCVLSAELFRHYKPDPEVYLGAAQLLDVAPAELLMVAAHPSDLAAAAHCGLRTAYVPRPLEHGPGGFRAAPAEQRFDFVAQDFGDLAAQLGA
jgi:2-haloacid dehalogenase